METPHTPQTPVRRYLFLQGNVSQFFQQLGSALSLRGHEVRRINFHAGDRLFWDLPGAAAYRGDLAAWPDFLRKRLTKWQITDVILFGDCRPLHRVAIRLAANRGIGLHVFEEGYVRPNWITFEQGGVNGHSALPRDPAWFHREAQGLPRWDEGVPVGGNTVRRITEDVLYNAAKLVFAWRYPGYRTHRPWPPLLEFAGKVRRFARQAHTRRRDAHGMLALADQPYFFFPLQLDSDSQIREHSPFGSIAPALALVIDSFARCAPSDSLLAIKEHPLDNGLRNWRTQVQQLAVAADIADRTVYLERADLEPLVRQAKGVVTINSTVGSRALAHGVPIITLGSSIYDMPGLTFQSDLDDFWKNATPPDQSLFDAFCRVLAARYMVNGGFFSKAGLALAVAASVSRLEAMSVLPALTAPDEAPRLSAREARHAAVPVS